MTAVAIRTCGGSWPKPRPSRNYGTCFGRRFNPHRWKRRWGSGHAAAPRTDARIGLTIFVLGLLTWASYLGFLLGRLARDDRLLRELGAWLFDDLGGRYVHALLQ